MSSTRIWQPPTGTHNVTIGPTMQAALDSLDGPASAPSLTEYYSVNYDYRPPSLDVRAPGKISATNEPQSDGLPSFKMQYGSAEAGDLHAYAGSQSQAKEFECVLIYDEATGEITFERLDSVITLQYDRASSSHAAARPLDNSPGSAVTVSSGSPPTPPNVVYNGFDNVQVADINIELDTEETGPMTTKPTPPSRPTHAAKSVMVVAPPERPAVPTKGKGKRNRDSLAEKEPPARRPPAKRLPATAAPPPPPPPPPPAAPLALPARPPTPPSGMRSPNAYVPASTINFSDDDDEIPLSTEPPKKLSKGFTLEVEENPVLPPARVPFSEGLIEEEAPNIDKMFDGFDYDEEDGEAEGEDDDQDEDDDFRIDVDEPDQVPRGPPISMNDLAGGDDDEDDEDEDEDDESDDDSD